MIKVLRTAAGAFVAPGIINNLKEYHGVQVVAADISELSAGFAFADICKVVSRVSAPGYLDELLQICKEESVDIFIPDLDEELLLVSQNKAKFEELGTKLIISEPEVLEIATSKKNTFDFFHKHNFLAPYSTLSKEEALTKIGFPMLLKPEYGRGSVGIYVVQDEDELEAALSQSEGITVFQEYLPGDEYTIDTLSDMEGNFKYCSIRQRVNTDSGISVKGITISDNKLESLVGEICDTLRLKGPGCLQCKATAEGEMKFIEINPRIAGTTILSIKAGAPILHDLLNLHFGKPIIGKAKYKAGFKMARYWSETYSE